VSLPELIAVLTIAALLITAARVWWISRRRAPVMEITAGQAAISIEAARVLAQTGSRAEGMPFRVGHDEPREPLAPDDRAVAALDIQAETRAAETPRRRVLLVDDEPDLAEALAEILRHDGHEVAVASDGPGALELARRFRPEVVVCDLSLPGMNGYEVAMRLRAAPETAACHLLALSGYGDQEVQRRAEEAGFDRHLTKPVGSRELREVLATEPTLPRGTSRRDPDRLDGL
jgi:CheY-like chemotaxis protein